MKSLSIRDRILLATVPVITVLVVLMVVELLSAYSNWRRESELLELTRFAPTFSAMVDNLQRERGYSAGFISSQGNNFRANLGSQRQDGDDALEDLVAVFPDLPESAAAEDLRDKVQDALQRLEELNDFRDRVDALDITVPEMARFYTGTINTLIDAVEAMLPMSTEYEVLADLGTYLGIMEAKERAGLERAMGATGFSSGAFAPPIYRNFVRLIAQQEAFLSSARAVASDRVVDGLDEVLETPEELEMQRLRSIVLANADTGETLGDVTGPEWFAASSARIEKLFEVEQTANRVLVDDTEALVSAALRSLTIYFVLAIVITIGSFLIAFAAIRSITRPVIALTDQMAVLASGDTDFEVVGRDQSKEIGKIADAMEVFRQNRIEADRLERQIESDRVAQQEARRAQEAQISDQVSAIVRAASEGDLSARVESTRLDGVLREVGDGINGLLETLSQVFSSLEGSMAALAEGDLTHRSTGRWAGRFQTMNSSMDRTADDLGVLMRTVTSISSDVNQAATEVSRASDDLADRTTRQAANLEEVAAAMEEIVATVRSTADAAGTAREDSESALRRAKLGGEIAEQAAEAMQRMVGTSAQIASITAMIEDIAFQTNLLALNAAVEAARAGDNGRGFAVVAQEVRNLAQRSSESSRNIKQLIETITGDVQTGAGLVDQVKDALGQIVGEVSGTARQTADIATAAAEQRNALGELNTSVTTMDDFTQRNATAVQQTADAAEGLRRKAAELTEQVNTFRL